MFSGACIGKYYPINSIVHRLNSTCKIIMTLMMIILIFVSQNLIYQFSLLVLTIIMLLLSNIPIRMYLKEIWSLRIIVLFLVIIDLIFRVPLSETIVIINRLLVMVLYTTVLTLSTPPTEISYGLEVLLKPFNKIGLNVNNLALSLTLSLRFIPTILAQADKILKSQASRGIDFSNSDLKGKLLAISSMLIPMFILSFQRADQLADSMEVRLYNCHTFRTNYRMNKWKVVDSLILMTHMVPIIILVIIK